jgi:hypothetical protein
MTQQGNHTDSGSKTFAPKLYYLIVWVLTFLLGLFGVVVSEVFSVAFWVWLVVAIVAIRQIWVTRWVTISDDTIRVRNVVGVEAATEWSSVISWSEREIPVRRERLFIIVKLTGANVKRPDKKLTITVDSDTHEFDTVRALIRESVPPEAAGGTQPSSDSNT